MRDRASTLVLGLILTMIWVGITLLRPRFVNPYEIQWYLGVSLTGAIAAVIGICFYRWWKGH